MKKLSIIWLAPLVLVACGDMSGGTGELGGSLGDGEILSGNSYGDGTPATAAKSEYQDLMYAGPKYHIGTPYKIDDTEYAPSEDYSYDRTGMIGIVPIDLNGLMTTNGEKFDTGLMIATSKVLPLPSIVKVTNLENGLSVVVRVNHRGPYVNNRLMDVTPLAARKLGMTGQTSARIQIMANESKRVKAMTNGELPSDTATPTATISETTVVDQPSGGGGMTGAGGPYTVQAGAYYSQESARAVASRLSSVGNFRVVETGGMHKVQMTNLSTEDAKNIIRRLRNEENMAPGLIKNGRWINSDSI